MSKFIERVLQHDPALRQSANPYTLEQTSEVFNRVIKGSEIIERVTLYLVKKALHEKAEQGEHNKTTLGNVQFWFNNVRNANKVVIKSEMKFSNIVEEWQFESILISIEEAERSLLIQQGVGIDINYKPVN